MKKLIASILLAAVLQFGTGCSSSEFKVVLTMAKSGADYVAIVSGHQAAESQIDAAFALANTEYNSFVAGTSTLAKIQGALSTLQTSLNSIFASFNITDTKTQGLVQLTVNEVISLVNLIPASQQAVLHKALKAPSANVAKAASPTYKKPAEFKAAFNAAAGTSVIK